MPSPRWRWPGPPWRPPARSRSPRGGPARRTRIEGVTDVDGDLAREGVSVPGYGRNDTVEQQGHDDDVPGRDRAPLYRGGAAAESLGQVSGLGLIATHDLDGVAARYRPRADGTGHVPGADDADGAHSVCSLPRLELWLCLVRAGSGSARRLSCAFPWRQVIDMERGHP